MKGKEENTQTLLSSQEAAKCVRLSARTIQNLGQRWEGLAAEEGEIYLPSSPRNGLRRIRLCDRVHRYHPRDLDEFAENATRESLGQPNVAWRKENNYHGE